VYAEFWVENIALALEDVAREMGTDVLSALELLV